MSTTPRVTPAERQPGQAYATLDEILACSDLPELDVSVDFWPGSDGRPLLLRVRGLDLVEQDRVRTAAARAVDPADRALGVTQHWPTFVIHSLALGVAVPRMTVERARPLAQKNARACELLVDLIWTISASSQARIDELFKQAAGLAGDDGAGDPAPLDPGLAA